MYSGLDAGQFRQLVSSIEGRCKLRLFVSLQSEFTEVRGRTGIDCLTVPALTMNVYAVHIGPTASILSLKQVGVSCPLCS